MLKPRGASATCCLDSAAWAGFFLFHLGKSAARWLTRRPRHALEMGLPWHRAHWRAAAAGVVLSDSKPEPGRPWPWPPGSASGGGSWGPPAASEVPSRPPWPVPAGAGALGTGALPHPGPRLGLGHAAMSRRDRAMCAEAMLKLSEGGITSNANGNRRDSRKWRSPLSSFLKASMSTGSTEPLPSARQCLALACRVKSQWQRPSSWSTAPPDGPARQPSESIARQCAGRR
jgi:hypothetical protein